MIQWMNKNESRMDTDGCKKKTIGIIRNKKIAVEIKNSIHGIKSTLT